MKRGLLLFCDAEEDYAQHMSEYLRRKGDFPWEIAIYTQIQELAKVQEEIDLLLIAEEAYMMLEGSIHAKQTVVLKEHGSLPEEKVVSIDKYQSAENIKRKLIELYRQECGVDIRSDSKVKFIGMYSPVRRCLQTTFALTYGQLLAEKHRTLYLSFECYGSRQEWSAEDEDGLAELLYFLPQEDNFLSHIKAVVRKVGNLDYVTPMMNGHNLLYVSVQEWLKLLHCLAECGEYEYIILDLSENMQGIFEILRFCSRIYTIVKEEPVARCKVTQYEQLLALQEYEDVKRKTSKYVLPLFRKLPTRLEQYTKGELAEYVRELLYKEETA